LNLTKVKSRSLGQIINSIAKAISDNRISKGELAKLKRIDMGEGYPPSFWKLMLRYVWEEGELNLKNTKKWGVILSGMARMAPFHHNSEVSLGQALVKSNYAEGRFLRLLRSTGKTLEDSVRRISIFLSAKRQVVNWVEFAALILVNDPDKKEKIKERVAVDYYGVKIKEEKENE